MLGQTPCCVRLEIITVRLLACSLCFMVMGCTDCVKLHGRV